MSAQIKPYKKVNGINKSQHHVAYITLSTIDIVSKLLTFFFK